MSRIMKHLLTVITVGTACAAQAGYKLDYGEHQLELGGRVVLQLRDIEEVRDHQQQDLREGRVRRLRPYLDYRFADDWRAKLSWEFAEDKNSVRSAYLQYQGIEGLSIRIGNDTVPFSRERITSSAKQAAPERMLTGDTEFGVPGRQPGLHLEYQAPWPVTLYLSSAAANIHGDLLTEIQFISPVEHQEIPDELQDKGWINAARLDYSLGHKVKYRQGDFKRKPGLMLSASAYRWHNTSTLVELDNVTGTELSAALRGYGVSVDAQYNHILAETPYQLERPLFSAGKATLDQYSLESGVMLWAQKVELIGSVQRMSAKTWTQHWDVWELGLNYYLDKHDHKFQLSYRDQQGVKGKTRTLKEWVLQWQYNY